jgi:hypothetical protein
MRTRIEARRLILRPFEPADVEAAFEWFGDPAVMRFTAAGPDKSIEETRKRLSNFENHQQAHGFSKWVVLNATSGVATGAFGELFRKAATIVGEASTPYTLNPRSTKASEIGTPVPHPRSRTVAPADSICDQSATTEVPTPE